MRKKKNPTFQPTIKVGRDISVKDFIRTRIVTPMEIIEGMKNPVFPNNSIANILFNARYNAVKAIEGYDFT